MNRKVKHNKKILLLIMAIMIFCNIMPVKAESVLSNEPAKTYNIPVKANEEGKDSLSMISKSNLLKPEATINEKMGKYEYTIAFSGKMGPIDAEISSLKIIIDGKSIEVKKQQGDENYPQKYVFELDKKMDKIKTSFFIKAMNMERAADLIYDWSKAPTEEEKPMLNKSELESTIKDAKSIKKGNKTNEAYNELQISIDKAESILKEAKNQTEINEAKVNLKNSIDKFINSTDKEDDTKESIIYKIPVALYRADKETPSMAKDALISPAIVKIQDGKAIVELDTKPIVFTGIRGQLTRLTILSSGEVARKEGTKFIFEAPIDITKMQKDVLVEMVTDAMPVPQNARIRFFGNTSTNNNGNNSNGNIDKSRLNDAIFNSIGLASNEYTNDSWVAFSNALARAVTINSLSNVSQNDIDSATNMLNEKRQMLVKGMKGTLTNRNNNWNNQNNSSNWKNNNKNSNVKTYDVSVSMLKTSGGTSMADGALNHTAKVEELDGQYKYYVSFRTMQKEFGGKMLTGSLTKLFYVDGSKYEATNEGGGVWSFVLNSKRDRVNIAIWVDVMDEIMGGGQGSGEQDAILEFNWNGAIETTVKEQPKKEVKKTETAKKDTQSNKSKFSDTVGHWAEKAIDYVVNKGYFKGVSDKEFAPERTISRAEFVTVLGRMNNIDVSAYSKAQFKDISSSDYYYGYINWASEKGIINGLENGVFAPNKNLNREQMAVIMSKFLKTTGKVTKDNNNNVSFNDKENISSWALNYVEEMAQKGIIKGMDDGKFSPKSEFTRAQVAQVLYNIENK